MQVVVGDGGTWSESRPQIHSLKEKRRKIQKEKRRKKKKRKKEKTHDERMHTMRHPVGWGHHSVRTDEDELKIKHQTNQKRGEKLKAKI